MAGEGYDNGGYGVRGKQARNRSTYYCVSAQDHHQT
jgi:hypothetical protein